MIEILLPFFNIYTKYLPSYNFIVHLIVSCLRFKSVLLFSFIAMSLVQKYFHETIKIPQNSVFLFMFLFPSR
jgi:hypothetical protein